MKKKNRRLENVKYEFKHNKLAIFAAIYLIAIILVSVFVVFSSVDPDALDVAHKLQSPSSAHWFGTDELGRDYFIRVLYGGRVSLVVGVLAMLTSIVIGVTVGMVAGYFGGIVDNILMRIVDVFSSIPWIIMVTVVGLLFKKGLASIIIVIVQLDGNCQTGAFGSAFCKREGVCAVRRFYRNSFWKGYHVTRISDRISNDHHSSNSTDSKCDHGRKFT